MKQKQTKQDREIKHLKKKIEELETKMLSAQKASKLRNITEHKRSERALQASEEKFKLLTEKSVMGTLIDVTKRVQSEEKLRESEKKYRTVVKKAVEGIMVIQGENRKYLNKRMQEITGYSEKEYQTMPFLSTLHPDDLKSTNEFLKKLDQDEIDDQDYELRILTKTGDVKWIRASGSKITWAGQPAIIVFINDITERKRAEEASLESESRFSAFMDHFPAHIYIKDNRLRHVYANRATLEFAKRPLEEFIGTTSHDIFPSEVAQKIETSDRLVLDEHRVVEREFSTKGSTGQVMWKRDIKFLLLGPRGESMVGGIALDITERKEAEAALRQSETQLRRLANRLQEVEEMERKSIARELHDQVGQSLTALNLNLNLLRGQLSCEHSEKAVTYLNDCLNLVDGTMNSIRNVMADLRPPVLDDFGLEAALRWYLDRFRNRTGLATILRGKSCYTRLPEKIESAIFRIVQEAINNVAKHAGASKVSVRIGEDRMGNFRLVVQDDGQGFSLENYEKQKNREGWGIINMRERAIAIGGLVEIDSSPGKGTRVTITC